MARPKKFSAENFVKDYLLLVKKYKRLERAGLEVALGMIAKKEILSWDNFMHGVFFKPDCCEEPKKVKVKATRKKKEVPSKVEPKRKRGRPKKV